jgi:hypothetical protein
MIDWLAVRASIPKDGLPFIVAGGEDAVVERTEAYLLNFPIVKREIGKGLYAVRVFLRIDIPKREPSIVTSCKDMPILQLAPLHRIPLSFMPAKNELRGDSNRLTALRSSSEFDLIEDVDLPKRGSCCDEICFFGMVPDAMDFPIMFDLVLDDNLIWHAVVIFANGFSRFENLILELLSNELLARQINLCHNQRVLLLARSMCPVEDMAEPILVIAIATSLRLAHPPLHAERRPLELLGVECLVEVWSIPPPYEFLIDSAGEAALAVSNYFLHMPPIIRYKIRYSHKSRYTQHFKA